MGWTKLVTDEAELAGMPESALAAAKAQAEAKELEGYLLTLDIPSYLPVMTYCDNQALREEMYRAYSTRASDQGPNAGKWDNSKVMEEIRAASRTGATAGLLKTTPSNHLPLKWQKTRSRCWIS